MSGRRKACCSACFLQGLVFSMALGFAQVIGAAEKSPPLNDCLRQLETIAKTVESVSLQKADLFAANAKEHVQRKMRVAADIQNSRTTTGRKLAFGEIELIPDKMLPSDPRIALMLQRANTWLQSEDEILDFSARAAKRAASLKMKKSAENFDPSLLLRANSRDLSLLEDLAKEAGWGEILIVDEVLAPEGFRTQVLSRGQLFVDLAGDDIGHAGSAHALQWLMLTPLLEKEFGAGSARELLKFLSSQNNLVLWDFVFDRGRGYIRDLRGPQAFGGFGLAGRHSWLGVE